MAVLQIYASEDVPLLFTIVDDNDAAADLSTATAIEWVYVPKNQESLKVLLSGTYPFSEGNVTWYTDGTDGKFYVNIESSDWTNLTSGSPTGTHQARVTIAGEKSIVASAEMRLEPDYFS